jgi:hypothetical protein
MIQWEKALKWEEESFSLLPSLPCFPLITTNNPLLSTLCVRVLGSPVVRPSGLGPGRKTSLLSTLITYSIRYNYAIGNTESSTSILPKKMCPFRNRGNQTFSSTKLS